MGFILVFFIYFSNTEIFSNKDFNHTIFFIEKHIQNNPDSNEEKTQKERNALLIRRSQLAQKRKSQRQVQTQGLPHRKPADELISEGHRQKARKRQSLITQHLQRWEKGNSETESIREGRNGLRPREGVPASQLPGDSTTELHPCVSLLPQTSGSPITSKPGPSLCSWAGKTS